jgi:putative phage-type endonuclease
MSIDTEMRKTGIGASEIAAVLGLSPYQTAFDTWVRKSQRLKETPPTAIQRRGHYLERGIVEWAGDMLQRQVEWFDITIRHPEKSWMLATPDAWILENGLREAELQAKSVNWKNANEYGESGGDEVPVHVALQSAWTMAVADTQYTIVAALLGLDDLRIYTIRRDAEIEAAIIEAGQRFWEQHVVTGIAPEIGASQATTEYLRQKFPKQIMDIRTASDTERCVMDNVFAAHEEFDTVKTRKEVADNQVKMAIGPADGLLDGARKITWRLCRDTLDTDWSAAARELIERIAVKECGEDSPNLPSMIADLKREMTGKHCIVTKPGTRRLYLSEGKSR